jgi:hypothetical protein
MRPPWPSPCGSPSSVDVVRSARMVRDRLADRIAVIERSRVIAATSPMFVLRTRDVEHRQNHLDRPCRPGNEVVSHDHIPISSGSPT